MRFTEMSFVFYGLKIVVALFSYWQRFHRSQRRRRATRFSATLLDFPIKFFLQKHFLQKHFRSLCDIQYNPILYTGPTLLIHFQWYDKKTRSFN